MGGRVKDFLWNINPFKQTAYRLLCTLNAIKAIWFSKEIVLSVSPRGGQAMVEFGLSLGRLNESQYLMTPIIDYNMNFRQLHILKASVDRTCHFIKEAHS